MEEAQNYLTAEIDKVIKCLSSIRVSVLTDEYRLQDMIAELLKESDIAFKKEFKLGPRNRIDFLVEGGIGIEVKKGKPNRVRVTEQLERYAAMEQINAVILVVERTVNVPRNINGKHCILFGLNRLWGVALR